MCDDIDISNDFVTSFKCLASLATLRDSDQFSYKSEADYAISKAIKTYGPQLVLESIKLNITGDEWVNTYLDWFSTFQLIFIRT